MRTVIFLILALMLTSCHNIGEQEMVIVPKNFKGAVIVIFNQEDGKPIKYEGKKRVYKIPKSGILKTQFQVNDGWHEISEFYLEQISSKNRLSSFVQIEKVPTDTIIGFIGANGKVKKNSKGDKVVEFCEFYIGTKSDITQAQAVVEKLNIVKLAE